LRHLLTLWAVAALSSAQFPATRELCRCAGLPAPIAAAPVALCHDLKETQGTGAACEGCANRAPKTCMTTAATKLPPIASAATPPAVAAQAILVGELPRVSNPATEPDRAPESPSIRIRSPDLEQPSSRAPPNLA
jgi:hypothetical protein